jgi:hypothetical protein
MSIELLGGLFKTAVFLNVDGVAEVDFNLSGDDIQNTVSGTRVVALDDAKKGFVGTVGGKVGVSVNAGASKAVRPFFDDTISIPLFSNTFFSFHVRVPHLLYRNHTDIVVSHRKPSGNLPRSAPLRSGHPISRAYLALPPETPTSSSPSLTWMPRHPNNESTMTPFIFKSRPKL